MNIHSPPHRHTHHTVMPNLFWHLRVAAGCRIKPSTTKTWRDQRGVTLIELLVTMALLSSFLIVVSALLTASVDMQLQTGSYAAVTSDGRFALARLGYDIRRATAVSAPAGLGDSGSTLVLTIDGATHTYSLDNGRLQLDIDGTADYLTGDETTISSLNFQKLGNSGGQVSVRYNFTVTAPADNKPDVQTYTSTAELRL